jgi:hypothetical protein
MWKETTDKKFIPHDNYREKILKTFDDMITKNIGDG